MEIRRWLGMSLWQSKGSCARPWFQSPAPKMNRIEKIKSREERNNKKKNIDKFSSSFVFVINTQTFWSFLRKFHFKILLGSGSLFSRLKCREAEFYFFFPQQYLLMFFSSVLMGADHFFFLSKVLFASVPTWILQESPILFQNSKEIPSRSSQHTYRFTKQKVSCSKSKAGTLLSVAWQLCPGRDVGLLSSVTF